MAIVKVAILSTTFQNWYTASPSRRSHLTAQNTDFGHTGELRGTPPPAVPGSFPVPTIRGHTNNHNVSLLTEHGDSASTTLQDLGDSAPLDGGHDAVDTLISPDKIRNLPSSVWSSLHKFVHVDRRRLVPAAVVTCCIFLLLGWIFSFTLDAIFKITFALLLASVPLSVLFERENTHRRLDDIYERIDALQHHVMSLQLNQAMPAVVADVRYSAPIMASVTPANVNMLGQSSMQGVAQPAIYEENTMSAEPTIGSGDGVSDHRTIWRPRLASPIPATAFRYSPVIPSPPSRSFSPFIPPSAPTVINAPQHANPPIFNPSPPTNARRKPRPSNFFDRIKSSFPPRPAPADPPSHTTATSFQYPPFPPTNVQRKPRSSNFFNRIKYAFTTRPPSPIPVSHPADMPYVYPQDAYPQIYHHFDPPVMPRLYITPTPSPTPSPPPPPIMPPPVIRPYAPLPTITPIMMPSPIPPSTSLSPPPRSLSPTSPITRPSLPSHPLSQPVQSSNGHALTHQRPEETTIPESL
ncbi:hypothetical protein DFH94DRAFT_184524 [Russula ochroleuca]|uniref:Uncharacterized protein n=1 Tax=Russula ochroleuca TaxID=152965 RepID=A0A9P5TDV0_9AGAM|nr:hypothetical protein DFH94DRAFT_184524 [Russula ochroleuca]